MKDILKGKWNQLRGEVKMWWGKTTYDEVQKVEGSFDKTVGLIQEKYGRSKDRKLMIC